MYPRWPSNGKPLLSTLRSRENAHGKGNSLWSKISFLQVSNLPTKKTKFTYYLTESPNYPQKILFLTAMRTSMFLNKFVVLVYDMENKSLIPLVHCSRHSLIVIGGR